MNPVIEKFKEVEESDEFKRIMFTNTQLNAYVVFWRHANAPKPTDDYFFVGCDSFDLQTNECFHVTAYTYEELDEFLNTYEQNGWTLND